jgi:hypothetical protein
MENEDKAFNSLIKTLKHLDENRERIFRDDDEFTEFLCDAVQRKELAATVALYIYCSRYGVQEFKLVDLQVTNGGDRPPILVFIDAILAGQDISPLLNAIDVERDARRL